MMSIFDFLCESSFVLFVVFSLLFTIIYVLCITHWPKKISAWCKRKFGKFIAAKLSSSLPYHNLAPVGDYEKIEPYEEMLYAALKDNDVRNIAISGPYGSGKSSIIKTFLRRNPFYSNRIACISLASFCDEISDTGSLGDAKQQRHDSNILQRQLELSILQQLIYREPPRNIPYSRFRRIQNLSVRNILSYIFSLAIVAVYVIYKTTPTLFLKYFGYNDNILWLEWFFCLISVTLCIIWLISLIRFCSKLSCLKINIPNVELEIEKSDESSILNRHMDEIIYYFEAGTYEIIVFEDLDRFDSILIFQKLREINLILNSSKQIGKKIVFIYALRDDVFSDEKRTKFFDYMIPVVPIINVSNSGDMLLEFFERHKKLDITPSKDFLSNISIFIDSMRLLVSICNEYVLYHNILSQGKLNKDKLFGMIVYKNLHPTDFALLHNNQGVLANIFLQKTAFIKTQEKQLLAAIFDMETLLSKKEAEHLKNLTELRLLYLSLLAKKINGHIDEIECKNTRYNFWDSINEDSWEWFSANNTVTIHYRENHYHRTQHIQLDEIENEYGCYNSREKKIKKYCDNQAKDILRKISDLKNEKQKLLTITMAQLVQKGKIIFPETDNEQRNKLIGFLLSNSYIDEDYHKYISFFHEGSLTVTDNEFVMSVISARVLKWNYHLNNIDSILKHIQPKYFEATAVWNFDLLTHMLIYQSEAMRDKFDMFIRTLGALDTNAVEFIDKYLEHPGAKPELLFKYLAEYENRLWEIVETQYNLEEHKKDLYLSIILDGCNGMLVELNQTNVLKTFIESKNDILAFVDRFNNPDVVINAVEELALRFDNLPSPKSEDAKKVFEYIVAHNNFKLNTNTIQSVLEYYLKNSFDKRSFLEKNYSYIRQSEVTPLVSYINANWEEYFNNVIANLSQQSDIQDVLIEILNSETIDIEIKKMYLLQQNNRISDIQLIKDDVIKKFMFENNRIDATWKNVVIYNGDADTLNDSMIDFLGDSDNYKALATTDISLQDETMTEKNIENIMLAIMKSQALEEEAVENLVCSCPWRWRDFDFDKLAAARVNTLLKARMLLLTVENYSKLKEYFPSKHITLIEEMQEDFWRKYRELNIDNDDWCQILESKLDFEKKKLIIEQEYQIFIESSDIIKAMTPIVKQNFETPWNIAVIKSCISLLSDNEKMELIFYHLKSRKFSQEDTLSLILSLPEPYCKFAQPGMKPKLKKSDPGIVILDIVRSWGYVSKEKIVGDCIVVNLKRKFDSL